MTQSTIEVLAADACDLVRAADALAEAAALLHHAMDPRCLVLASRHIHASALDVLLMAARMLERAGVLCGQARHYESALLEVSSAEGATP